MISWHSAKWLVRSRSLQFVRDRDPARFAPGVVSSFNWRARKVHYRPGSSDLEVIYKILLRRGLKAEYHIPQAFNPLCVWDIGGNIGAASLFFSERFPMAQIHAFEPMPDNCALIRRNVEGLDRVRAHNFALGAKDGAFEIRPSDSSLNLGGYSFYDAGTASARGQVVQMRTPQGVIADGTAPAPDLIKIDTEGAEYDILTAMGPTILDRVVWITGELHGNRSFELLEYLSPRFDIEVKKSLGKRLFNFLAKNRNA